MFNVTIDDFASLFDHVQLRRLSTSPLISDSARVILVLLFEFRLQRLLVELKLDNVLPGNHPWREVGVRFPVVIVVKVVEIAGGELPHVSVFHTIGQIVDQFPCTSQQMFCPHLYCTRPLAFLM